MTSLFIIRFIKILMVTAPFLSMLLMVLALWGIGGKTTYTDLNSTKQQMVASEGEAKNYLVNSIKNQELSSSELENPEITVEGKSDTTKKEALPEKIDWRLVI